MVAISDGWHLRKIIGSDLQVGIANTGRSNSIVQDELKRIKTYVHLIREHDITADTPHDKASDYVEEITYSMEVLADHGYQLYFDPDQVKDGIVELSFGAKGAKEGTLSHHDALWIEADTLKPYAVNWDCIDTALYNRLRTAIRSAQNEDQIQAAITTDSVVLTQHLRSGGGRWVIPKARLGSEYVTDYMVACKDSLGMHWTAVELESPHHKPFIRSGAISAKLNAGIHQINSWRIWLQQNLDYARRTKANGGLNLLGIYPNVPGLILIGRDQFFAESSRETRRQLFSDQQIEVRSFDWLARQLNGRLISFSRVQAE